jgi:hypothetical protein
MVPTPTAAQLFLCDVFIFEERTRKASMVGCFSELRPRDLPTGRTSFSVAAALTGAQGAGMVKLEVQELGGLRVLYENEQQVRFVDRFQPLWVHFRLNDCRFAAQGAYQFSLLVDGELVALQTLRLLSTEDR